MLYAVRPGELLPNTFWTVANFRMVTETADGKPAGNLSFTVIEFAVELLIADHQPCSVELVISNIDEESRPAGTAPANVMTNPPEGEVAPEETPAKTEG